MDEETRSMLNTIAFDMQKEIDDLKQGVLYLYDEIKELKKNLPPQL